MPDKTSDGRITICCAGFSPTKGFIRIYPTTLKSPLKNWNIVRVPVEKDNRDTRCESWKIQGSKKDYLKLHEKIEVIGCIKDKSEKIKLLENNLSPCIDDLNDLKKSLGVIKPLEIIEAYFTEREDFEPFSQLSLEGRPEFITIKKYKLNPRLKYRCSGCKKKIHDQQLLEWGAYEWLRKNPGNEKKLWENLHLFDDEYVKYFLVGNISWRRSSFMVISVLRLKKTE